jgi:hypothetical protein
VSVLATIAAGAWIALAYLATVGDGIVTLGVALIGAAASIATAFISRGNRREIRARRIITTRHENGVTITDEEIDELSADGD